MRQAGVVSARHHHWGGRQLQLHRLRLGHDANGPVTDRGRRGDQSLKPRNLPGGLAGGARRTPDIAGTGVAHPITVFITRPADGRQIIIPEEMAAHQRPILAKARGRGEQLGPHHFFIQQAFEQGQRPGKIAH